MNESEKIYIYLDSVSDWLSGDSISEISFLENLVVIRIGEDLIIQAECRVLLRDQCIWEIGNSSPDPSELLSYLGKTPTELIQPTPAHLEIRFENTPPIVVAGLPNGNEWVQVIRPGETAIARPVDYI